MRRTKIVCTLGPSTDKEEVLRNLMKNGMNVARMNFSHGTHEEQKARLDMIKKLREELNLPVAALLDTKGPEIRIGDVEGGKLELKPGQEFTLTTEEMLGTEKKVTITYKELYKDVVIVSNPKYKENALYSLGAMYYNEGAKILAAATDPAKYEAEKDKADVQMKKAKEYMEQAVALNAANANAKKILDSINETLAK